MITQINERDLISMKLLHYFITKKNYNPVIVQGVENEIWLENTDKPFSVIRINNNYIHIFFLLVCLNKILYLCKRIHLVCNWHYSPLKIKRI